MQSVKTLLNFLHRLEAGAAVVAFVGISVLLLCDVLLRELAGTSIPGAQRISVYAMICTGFLGLSIAAARGRHLRPTFADGLVPKLLVPHVERFGSLILAATFFTFAYVALEFVIEAHEYGDIARVIEIPLWTIQVIMPYAFFSTGLRYFLQALYPALAPKEDLNH